MATLHTTSHEQPGVGDSTLAAGSAFFHASATKVGQLGDVFTMDLIMYQTHQLMVTKVLQVTSRALSQADRNTIFQLDSGAGLAANKARDLIRLFKQPSNHAISPEAFELFLKYIQAAFCQVQSALFDLGKYDQDGSNHTDNLKFSFEFLVEPKNKSLASFDALKKNILQRRQWRSVKWR